MPQIDEGCLLIAHPMLADPHFMRSVVYILEHNSGGSLGLICNRPLRVPLREVWEDCPDDVAEREICAEGGPVARERGLLLHGHENIPGSHHIASGILVGGDGASLYKQHQKSGGLLGPRLFLGHAGWGAGQLEAELATGSWLLRQGHRHLLLHAHPPDDLWQSLVDCGPELPQPSLN